MKTTLFISSLILVLGLSSCTTYNTYYNGYTDDVYGSAPVAAPSQQTVETPASVDSRQADEEDGTYVSNNYDGSTYTDYEYSSRIRRFYRPVSYNYYDSYYTNRYWYDNDPYYYGVSIYSCYGWRRPSWTWGVNFGYNWNYPGFNNYNNPWAYGYYNNNYNNNYYNDGGGNWSTNYNNTRDDNVHYGHRGSVNTSNGRGTRSGDGNRTVDNPKPTQRSLVTYTNGRSNSEARPSSGSRRTIQRTPVNNGRQNTITRPSSPRTPNARPRGVTRPSRPRTPTARPGVITRPNARPSTRPRTPTPRINTPRAPRINTPSRPGSVIPRSTQNAPRTNPSRVINQRGGSSSKSYSNKSKGSSRSSGSNRSSGSRSNSGRSPR